ncbi:MAG TPA: PP2C family protein-serine/threonine phosphatase, partial [Candidatus Solibacter sp.]|nr:PP2C family protein-serine/threonine phosphatase [Candidatus Solibacter sp.]
MASALMGIGEYLRDRLMPVEGVIPHLPGIEMYGDSIPAETVGGDLFEYINFQQRYDIEARIGDARRKSEEFLTPNPPASTEHNGVDDYFAWLTARPEYRPELEGVYRQVRSLERLHVAENLSGLYETAGILLVDAQGHGIISAKIASTVHDTFHAFMLCELDRYGTTTPELFENLNLRLARSVTARNALGRMEQTAARELATMLYGEVHPSGHFRFVNFGHPPPLLFSAASGEFAEVDRDRMVRFLPLGLEVPEDHPDRKRYTSMHFRRKQAGYSDIAEITLMNRGDVLFLYTDGVYDGSDEEERRQLEELMAAQCSRSARDICSALLEYAVKKDQRLRDAGEPDVIDDKTVFIIKR